MIHTEIENSLCSPALDTEWANCRPYWPELPPEQFDAILADIAKQRDHFLQATADISDPEQLESSVAMMYVTILSSWTLVNTQIAYQTQMGAPNPLATYHSSLLCVFLQALESLLSANITERLASVLADPLAVPAAGLLEIEFGTVSATQIIAKTRLWKDELSDLTRRLAEKTAEHDLLASDLQSQLAKATASVEQMQANQMNLRRDLGTWESTEIISTVRAARDAVAQLGDRLLELETNHSVLERELGTNDGDQIAALMRKLSAENTALRDVADLFGAMEDDLKSLEVH